MEIRPDNFTELDEWLIVFHPANEWIHSVQKLPPVQNSAAQFVSGKTQRDSILPVWKALQSLPVSFPLENKVLVHYLKVQLIIYPFSHSLINSVLKHNSGWLTTK